MTAPQMRRSRKQQARLRSADSGAGRCAATPLAAVLLHARRQHQCFLGACTCNSQSMVLCAFATLACTLSTNLPQGHTRGSF